MPCQPKGGPRLEDVTLGIDLGSYSTRAALRTATGSEFVIENKESMNSSNSYYAADFPSAIYPFDHVSQPVYLLSPDHSRRETSAKYAFYVLAYADDKLLEEYAVAQRLTNRQNDPAFRKQLRRGIVGLLTVVRDATMTVCRSKRYRIARIGLSIPVQWTSDFEDVY
ncbi:hypothetical protein B0T14DRAFT_496212 [Immersiella caudata]|uniref:Uncharacterized protein n=1 Tax=Immersiella caudata TaxID=314043 RepID=A0AA39WQ54_9PEZI|nr:hypothetical protein B0T14DRAFT_496212 [Immersiella caudata]